MKSTILNICVYLVISLFSLLSCTAKGTKKTETTIANDSSDLFYPSDMNYTIIDSQNTRKELVSISDTKEKDIYLHNTKYNRYQSKLDITNPTVDIISYRNYNNPKSVLIRDSIYINNQAFCLDELFYENSFTKKSAPIFAIFDAIYELQIGENKKFLVFICDDDSYPSSSLDRIIFLFDISNLDNIQTLSLGYERCTSIKTFSEFNNNLVVHRLLEAKDNSTGLDTLACFELIKNKLRKMDIKELLLKSQDGSNNVYHVK